MVYLVKANSFHKKSQEAEIMAVEFECENWAPFLVIHARVENCQHFLNFAFLHPQNLKSRY